MPNETIRPTTITGIKTLAKELKVSEGLRHAAALDKAAKVAGHQNFAHARRQLSAGALAPAGYTVYITTYWRTRPPLDAGQETISVNLSVPLDQLVRPHHLKQARHLRGFRFTASDHLVDDTTTRSQSEARRRACAVIRTLAFMEATSLKPSGGRSRAYPRGSYQNVMPGHDHSSEWFDPGAKAHILVDEPYSRAVEGISAERLAWADHFNWEIVKTTWGGMYFPEGNCEMYLAADKAKGYSLTKILDALNALPPPMVEEGWNGKSGPMQPSFLSPGDKAKAEAPKPAPKPRGKSEPRVTAGYYTMFDSRQRRRPATRMPIEAHAEVGKLLKAVIAQCFERAGVKNRLEHVRSDLDDWVQHEYGHDELPNERFFELYYRDENAGGAEAPTGEAWRAKQIEHLQRAKAILTLHYPDCAPVRTLLTSIDAAIKSLRSWAV